MSEPGEKRGKLLYFLLVRTNWLEDGSDKRIMPFVQGGKQEAKPTGWYTGGSTLTGW